MLLCKLETFRPAFIFQMCIEYKRNWGLHFENRNWILIEVTRRIGWKSKFENNSTMVGKKQNSNRIYLLKILRENVSLCMMFFDRWFKQSTCAFDYDKLY